MRKLLYLILFLPFIANAQISGIKVGAPIIRNDATDKYATGYAHLLNGGFQQRETIAGRDSISSLFPGLLKNGLQVKVMNPIPTVYEWRSATSSWVTVQYGIAKSYVDSARNNILLNDNSDISFGSSLWKDKILCSYSINIGSATQFPQVNIVTGNALGAYWAGTVYVDKTKNIGHMTAIQWDNYGKIYYKYERTKDDSQPDWGQWTRIWTDESLPLGTVGQSIRVNSLANGFEAYTPAASATPTLQSVTTAGNTTTTRISAAGYDVTGTGGLGFINLPSQSTSIPTTPASGVNLYFGSSGFGWKRANGIFNTFLGTGLTASRLYNLPNASGTLSLRDTTQDITGLYRFLTSPVVIGATPSVTFTDANGNSTLASRSATGNTTTLTSANVPAGNIGKAIAFVPNQYGAFSDAGFSSGTNPLLGISFWFKTTTTTVSTVFQIGNQSSSNALRFRINSNGRALLNNGPQQTSGTLSFNDGGWHHAVINSTGSATTLYIDNLQQATNTTSWTLSLTGSAYIGVDFLTVFSGYFNGSIDQLIIANTPFSTADRNTIYAGGAGVYNPSVTNKQMDVEFDIASSTTSADLLGAHNVTFTGSPSQDLNGKVPVSATGSATVNPVLTVSDAPSNGAGSQIMIGHPTAQNITQGQGNSELINGFYPKYTGLNGYVRFDPYFNGTLTANKNSVETGVAYFGSPNLSTVGTIQYGITTTAPVASSLTAGGQYMDATYRLHNLSATTDNTVAYLTDVVGSSSVVSTAATLTLLYGRDYSFAGTTSTWTLPAIASGTSGRYNMITIKNRGTGNITINSNTGGADIYDTVASATLIVAPGVAVTLLPDGTYFTRQ